MAKKTPRSSDSSTPTPAPPARRRAPAQKKTAQAAPAIDIATVGRSEPVASASDTGVAASANEANSAPNNGGHQPTHEEIAEAAYFRHLKRGGAGGDEFDDWVEAERELRERQH
jgi:hypothetical protein